MKFLRSFEVATAAACLIMMMSGAISAGHLEQRFRGSRVARMLNATPESATPPSPKLRGLRSVPIAPIAVHRKVDLMDDIVEIVPATPNLSKLMDLKKRTNDVWRAYKRGEITAEEAHEKMECIKKDLMCLKKEFHDDLSDIPDHTMSKLESALGEVIVHISELEARILDHKQAIEVSLPEVHLPPIHHFCQTSAITSEVDAYVTKAERIMSWYKHGVMTKEEAYNVLVALRGGLVSFAAPCMHESKVQAAVNAALSECFRLQNKLDYIVEHIPTTEEIISVINVQAHEIWEAYSAGKMLLHEAVAAVKSLRRELVEKTYALGTHVDLAVQNAIVTLVELENRLMQAVHHVVDHTVSAAHEAAGTVVDAAGNAVEAVDATVDTAVSHAHIAAGNAVDAVDSAVGHAIDGVDHVVNNTAVAVDHVVDNTAVAVDHVVDHTAAIVDSTGEAALGAVDTTVAHVRLAKEGLLRSINHAIEYAESAKQVTVEQINQHLAAKKQALIGAAELTHEQMRKIDQHLASLVDHVRVGAEGALAHKEMLLQFLVNLRVKIHAVPSKFITLAQLTLFTNEVHMQLSSDLAVMMCYKRRELEKHMEALKTKCAAIAPALSEHEWCQEEVQTCQQQLEQTPPCEVAAVPLPNLEQHGGNTQALLNKLHSSWFGKVNHVEQLVTELEGRGTPQATIDSILEALIDTAN